MFTRKLDDVRGRLDQLRELLQYYESGTRFIHDDDDGDEEETGGMPPAMPDLSQLRKHLQ